MFVPTCTANDILELNQSKEYTLTSTGILESVLTNPNLNAQTVKLWQFLFNKSKFQPNLDVKICYKELASKLHRSARSISRYVQTLVREGFLLIEENFSNDGSQRPNTLYVRIPNSVAEQIKNTKDRVTNKNYLSTNNESSPSTLESVNQSNNVTDTSDISYVATPISEKSNQGIENLDADEIGKTEPVTGVPLIEAACDKIVGGEDDKNVVQKINIKKDIILNNNIVVDSFHHIEKENVSDVKKDTNVLRETLPKQDHFKEITEIEAQINSLYRQMLTVTWEEKTRLMTEIKKLQAIVTTKTVIMNQQNRTEKALISCANENTKSTSHIDSSINFSQINAERELSKSDLTRLKKAINTEITALDDQQRIFNEIIFAIRFGSLRTSQSGQTLSVSHAVSIGLKLLREKRWETPSQLRTKTAASEPLNDNKTYRKYLPQGHQQIGNLLKSVSMGLRIQ